MPRGEEARLQYAVLRCHMRRLSEIALHLCCLMLHSACVHSLAAGQKSCQHWCIFGLSNVALWSGLH